MSGAFQSILAAVFGLLLAIVLGALLGEGSWWLPVALVGACVVAFIRLVVFRRVQNEALIVGFLLLGYIVGNRGFAQLSVGGPFFFGEVGLGVCAAILLIRFAVNRRPLFPNTPLGWSIVFLLVLGAFRLYLDVVAKVSGVNMMMALRDSAVIYYAGFFMVGYQAAQHEPSRRFVHRCVLGACVLLLVVAMMELFLPGTLLRFTFRGNPLIYQKGDLITSYLAFASFYFLLHPSSKSTRFIWIGLSIAAFAAMMLFLQRAGLVGYFLAAVLLIVARRPQFIWNQFLVGLAVIIVFMTLSAANMQKDSQMIAQALDKLESIVDVSQSRQYRSAAGEQKADNNQYRLVWWRSVADETFEKGPWLGLGFGYDLAAGFLRNYYAGVRFEFGARSPHSIWFTVLGRMGVIGLLAFTVVSFLIFREAYFAARRVAIGRASTDTLADWCCVLVLFGAASFGVVLEGPMGGVLFWSFLGLAVGRKLPEKEPSVSLEEISPQTRHRFHPMPRPQLSPAFVERSR